MTTPTPPQPVTLSLPGNGTGRLTVNTGTLTQVADMFAELAGMAQSALAELSGMAPVSAGHFEMAEELAAGPVSVASLARGYHTVLTSIHNSLLDAQSAMCTVVSRYQAAEDINNVSASDLTTAMSDLTTDIKGLGSITLPGGTVGS